MQSVRARITVLVFGFVIAIAATSCVRDGDETHDGAPVDISVGETTPEGRLILFEWVTQEGRHRRQAALVGDYGMMAFYDYTADPPEPPRFELCIQADKTIVKTTDLAAFIAQLDRLPKGATLDWYNTCTGGTHYRLPKEIAEAIQDACTERGIILREGPGTGLMICTCS